MIAINDTYRFEISPFLLRANREDPTRGPHYGIVELELLFQMDTGFAIVRFDAQNL